MAESSRFRRRRWGLAIGFAATAAGYVLWSAGLLDPMNQYALGLHFRHLGTLEADPRIVLIDINDHALTAVHRWPWPRRLHAQLVGILDELGAEAIVLDIGFFERAERRIDDGGLGPYYEIEAELVELGDPATAQYIHDDLELRDAITLAGNVYLAMYFRTSPPAVDPPALLERALALVRSEPEITFREFRSRLSPPPPWNTEDFYNRARLATLLEEDFRLDAADLAQLLDPFVGTGSRQPKKQAQGPPRGGRKRPPKQKTRRNPGPTGWIEKALPSAKRLAARRLAARALSENTRLMDEDSKDAWPAFFATVLPEESFDMMTADRSDLRSAFLAQRAVRTIMRASPKTPPPLGGRIPHAYDLTVPLDMLARAAKGVGFAAFERNTARGVVQSLPLVVDGGGFEPGESALFLQLGVLVAADALASEFAGGYDRAAIGYSDGLLTIGDGDEVRRLPLDEDGQTLLNWHAPQRPDLWTQSFRHIPVTRLMEIVDKRCAIADNKKRLGIALGKLVDLRHRDTPAEYVKYERLINRRLETEPRASARAKLAKPGDRAKSARPEDHDSLDREIRRIEEEAIVWLRRAWSLWGSEEPRNETERVEREAIRDLSEQFGSGQLAARLDERNRKLAQRSRALVDELRPLLAGKICLVGYTATAVPDFVTTPVHASAPGVMVHANIINMLLKNKPAIAAPVWVNGLVILVAGLVITIVTCVRGPLLSLAAMLAMVALILLAGGVAFWLATYYVASLAASTLVCVTWAAVTVYRQFTEERARRQFHRALAQYTSPAVAARIASTAANTGFAPRPARVTCFFSDLEGFTLLSERLGAERTRLVLNPYLGALSRVLTDHHALVNKFMGDGVFAFFNAPIWPCADHCEAACAGALAARAALRELNRLSHITGPLVMRIGLSTGEVFVGDYGSDTKLDYTCIGDTVNLGSRLEQANKALGTSVLVDEPTRLGGGDRFVFRGLGRVVVAGFSAPVTVFELVGEASDVDAAARAYIARFEQAVEHYQHCKWDRCDALLRACRAKRSHDGAATLYQNALARRRVVPSPPDWRGTIALPVR